MNDIDVKEKRLISDSQAAALLGGGAVAAVATISMAPQPAFAAGSADVAAEITGLGTLAAAALVVALTPFGVFYAFKIVRRVMAGA